MKIPRLLIAPFLAITATAAESTKPNIILLFADDLTSQAISAYQHPLKLLETPHEMKKVYDDPADADTRKTLHTELARLRTEWRVPEQDPAGTGGNPAGGARRGAAKAQ